MSLNLEKPVFIAAHAVVMKMGEMIDLSDESGESVVVGVVSKESAWGFGTRFNKQGNWAWYFLVEQK